MKGLVVGDAHFCDYVPVKRTDDFLEAQFRKMAKIRSLSEELDTDVVILLGDVFDKARPDIWLLNKVIDHLQQFSCSIYSLVGNHDLQGSRDGVPGTALGTLLNAGLIKGMDGDIEILGVPFRAINHTREHSTDLYQSDSPRIILTHNMITPQIAPFEHVYAMDVLEKSHNCFIFAGDFHDPFEFYNPQTKTRIMNPGVLNRTSIAEKHITPSVIYFEATSKDLVVDFRRIPLGAAVGKDVFDIALHEKVQAAEMNLKKFIDSINQTQFESQDIEKLVLDVGKQSSTSDKVIAEAVARIKAAKSQA